MQSVVKEKRDVLKKIINSIFNFSLSDKLKFAIKASLSMALAYLIPLSQGWSQPGTAATTVMLIAAMGSVGDSVMKGALRVIGTVIGAAVGMTLIGLFPQDREVYLLVASVVATLFLYLARAYKGDMTVFLLSAVTLLMMFQNGEVDNVFIYGIDKTYMTIVGIIIYTLVGVFLWPVNLKDTSVENAAILSTLQSEMYQLRDGEKEERKVLQQKMISQEQLLGTSIIASDSSSMEMNFSKTQWFDIVNSYKKIDELLTLFSQHDKASYADNFPDYVTNYKTIDTQIIELLDALPLAWKEQKEIAIPEVLVYQYDIEEIKTLSQLERAEMSTTISDMLKLHTQLRKLAEKLNSLISPMPTLFTLEDIHKPSDFLWFDMEDLKGTLISFIIFWFATLLWIFANPPGGFMIVILATALSVLTTFSPLKPSLLIIIFSLSFVFATAMYILVLPNLHYGWELGLFVFVYAFIGFYFINPMLAVFFLLGTATLGINNTMSYNFDVFLITLFAFYAFLFLLLLFYYIPFSTKPEHLFLVMKKRFFTLAQILLQRSNNLSNNNGSFLGAMRAKYSMLHLKNTVKKMQLWASKIDEKYFDSVDKDMLLGFSKECETLVYLLEMMYHREIEMIHNPFIKAFKENSKGATLVNLLSEYAGGKDVKDLDPFWRDEEQIVSKMEERLTHFIHEVKYNEYNEKDIIEFYESISLRRNVWLSLFSCQKMMEKIDFKALETSRF
ncbi:FUSC family protein [Sulfurovum sp.]|uniref:FUSC family protein n=1 Tax=Sulfurovum sp. TaxID=1969726 RepID=UPI00286825CE|nr:FUSC family protein [Sulfurovum sp.]